MIKRILAAAILSAAFMACENENTPQPAFVVSPLSLTIDENPLNGELLGTVVVSPENQSYEFSLTNEVPAGAMTIDATGAVRVLDSAAFDYEVNEVITADVEVRLDGGTEFAKLTVNINDVNESGNYTIWTGPNLSFTKNDGTDPTQEANQDRINDDVWITRGTGGGQIYNAVTETSANRSSSPAGTKWAIGTISNIEKLEFQNFRDAVGDPKDVAGKDLILYLENEDAYLSVKFSAWSQGNMNGGGFAYTRSTR